MPLSQVETSCEDFNTKTSNDIMSDAPFSVSRAAVVQSDLEKSSRRIKEAEFVPFKSEFTCHGRWVERDREAAGTLSGNSVVTHSYNYEEPMILSRVGRMEGRDDMQQQRDQRQERYF